MAANPSIQLGTDGNWAIKEDNLLAYKKDGTRFFNKEFDFTRNTTATFLDQNGLIQESATNTPRIDFTDNATGHLLLEPQRTNLIPYSEDFSQWTTQGAISTASNYGISPDGENNSTRILFSGGSQQIYENFTSLSGVTGSIYIKGNSGEAIKFGVTGGEQTFTLNGDWQRLTTYSGSSTRLTINTFGAAATARDIQLWGAQVEEGSYATSYIPTAGSTVTRNEEVCNNSGSVQDFNSEEGVLYTEIAALADDVTNRLFSLSNGTTSNRIFLGFNSLSNSIRFRVQVNNVYQAENNFIVADITQYSKIAFKYKENYFALWVNGVEVVVDNSGSTFPLNTINKLNLDSSSGGSLFYGKTKNLKVFKRAMSDDELYLLTVPQYQSYQEMAAALNYTL